MEKDLKKGAAETKKTILVPLVSVLSFFVVTPAEAICWDFDSGTTGEPPPGWTEIYLGWGVHQSTQEMMRKRWG